jgi:hypothetical protein
MSQTSSEMSGGPSNSGRRYAVAALLLEKWMSEDTDYDERVWPALEEEAPFPGSELPGYCRMSLRD